MIRRHWTCSYYERIKDCCLIVYLSIIIKLLQEDHQLSSVECYNNDDIILVPAARAQWIPSTRAGAGAGLGPALLQRS